MEKKNNTVIVLIGIPGSGKDYFCRNLNNYDIHSSDSIREELFDSEVEQKHNDKVFSEMFKRTMTSLKNKQDVIYNATNLIAKRRIHLINEVRRVYPNTIFIARVFATPYEICLQNNSSRTRNVPEEVINRMYKFFEPPHYSEGFNQIEIQQWNERSKNELVHLMLQNDACPHDNPHHTLSCGGHCRKTSEIAQTFIINNNIEGDIAFALYEAALYHDLSKFKCKTFNKNKDAAHFYNHENVSAYDYLCFAHNISHKVLTSNLIAHHMDYFKGEKYFAKIKERYGDEFVWLLNLLHDFDLAAH